MNKMAVERDGDGKVTGVTITDLEPALTFERVR
jgi:hypothetical protein